MKTRLSSFASLTCLVILAACTSVGVYHPARFAGDEGFSEKRLGSDQYRVMFRGNATTSRETVEDYLLLHAAEITLQEGNEAFIVIERDMDVETHIRKRVHPAMHGRVYHYWDGGPLSFPYYAYGHDWSYPTRWSHYEVTEYVAVAYIRVINAVEAESRADAFIASDVVANLDPVTCYKEVDHNEDQCPFVHKH